MLISPKYQLLLTTSLVSTLAQDISKSACEALKTLRLENTTIVSATRLPTSTNFTTLAPPECLNPTAFVSTPICRVEFFVNTTSTSSIRAEAWLPDTWYGRFLGLGNGGLNGCIDYINLDYGSSYHFATVSSNNGHDGADGIVFYNKPEVINDFAYRAVHTEAVIGKQIVQTYYGSPHHRSYYLGCSSGGRQGTQAALKYPDDFDGIVAGAPATDMNHLTGWAEMVAGYIGTPNANSSSSLISPALWGVITTEILNQCDTLDGVEDGIITEPDDCDFRPEVIKCKSNITEGCLTAPQIEAIRKVYQPLYDTQGRLLFPRYDPGAQAGEDAEVQLGIVFTIARDWYRYTIFNDPNHDFSNFSVKDVVLGDNINPGGIRTFDGDLSEFKNRGGKFLVYHGRRDQIIPSGNAKRLYNLISKTLRMPSLDTFYRLFLIPGMDHCAFGPGAWRFGQWRFTDASFDALNASSHNVLLAMVDWVEKGVAPDTVIGTADDGTERPHCRYPQKSIWNGEKFVCR
ncbi:hypothetical protein H0H87_012296 [Tephrocybe sp. NHM501043]|nr:hypothetical protein H0H87_012296 [Tephrocybe sp. NHM501043]